MLFWEEGYRRGEAEKKGRGRGDMMGWGEAGDRVM